MLTLKICVVVFSRLFKARMLKLCIHIDKTMSCIVGSRIGLLALILPFICPFFLSFRAKFVSQLSQELYKVESSNMVYIIM